MKRILPFVLILCMVFAGCAKAPAGTEPSTSAPTVAPHFRPHHGPDDRSHHGPHHSTDPASGGLHQPP